MLLNLMIYFPVLTIIAAGRQNKAVLCIIPIFRLRIFGRLKMIDKSPSAARSDSRKSPLHP